LVSGQLSLTVRPMQLHFSFLVKGRIILSREARDPIACFKHPVKVAPDPLIINLDDISNADLVALATYGPADSR